MSESQNRNSQIFVDYIPAELHENKTWEIVYYVKNPFTGKLVRKRNRVKPLKNIALKRRLATNMKSNINSRLESGWNPFYQSKGTKELTKFSIVADIYIKQKNIEHKDQNLSFDTIKTYSSRLKNFREYLERQNLNDILCYQLTHDTISDFLDYLRYKKGLSARGRDNYMTFLKTLCKWMLSKKYITTDPSDGLVKTNNKVKVRVVIPEKERQMIFDYYKKTNINFLVYCMTCYYCLARRTEMTKLKVSDIDLQNSTLFISAEDSKNNKSAHVTIPPELSKLLANHIKNAKLTDLIFSNNNYGPGVVKFKPNKATSNWARMRNRLKISKNIQWYSLKDTGITDLILSGIPLISVRDQARHYSITQTEDYVPRSMKKADKNIQNSGVSFT